MYEGKYVIVRGDKSGVFAGVLKSKEGREVTLTDARKIWYWQGAVCLSQLASEGTSNPNGCKFPAPVAEVCITDAIEIFPCTDQAEQSIRGVHVWTL
nr:MAG TPA_asm: hypothetical protein [Caudoviricetes sp.]